MSELVFVPFEETEPDSGRTVELRVPNPSYAEDLARHEAALAFNPFATSDHVFETTRPTLKTRPEDLVDADTICIDARRLYIVVCYPFDRQHRVLVRASRGDGFTHAELFRQLVRVYTAMYDGASVGPSPVRYNVHVESERFGTAWHRLEHLVIEGVVVDERGGEMHVWIAIGT